MWTAPGSPYNPGNWRSNVVSQKLRPAVLLLGLSGLLSATAIDFPQGKVLSISNACANFAGYTCTITAYFDDLSLDDQNDGQNINGLFQSAFDTWNAGNAVGSKWTLNFGGDTLGGTFHVYGSNTTGAARANQFDNANNPSTASVVKGGLDITIALEGVTLPTLGPNDVLGWSQGLFDDYLTNGTTVPPFFEMDIDTSCIANASFCAPLYPFQYIDNHFFDEPKARYQAPGTRQAFFDANAYFSVAT
jgi:hypothetical protein